MDIFCGKNKTRQYWRCLLMKFKVSKGYLDTLKIQLKSFESSEIITSEQRQRMLGAYEETKSVNMVRLISVVGSVLVGLGILTYIAGNWQNMSPVFRMALLVVGLVGFYMAGMAIDSQFPRTARALRYIALFIYGSGLFLTDQTFHLNRPVAFHFLVWAVGILASLYFETDSLQLYFYQLLIVASVISLGDGWAMTELQFYIYLLASTLGLAWGIRLSEMDYRTSLSALLGGAGIAVTLLVFLGHLDVDFILGAAIMLVTGCLFLFRSPLGEFAGGVMPHFGLFVAGFSGFAMTFKEPWAEILKGNGTTPSVVFTVFMLMGLFYLVRKGYAAAIVFIALVIMRYYFDTFFDFMPKSMFFVIGGIMLIGFGVYLESVRRKGGISND